MARNALQAVLDKAAQAAMPTAPIGDKIVERLVAPPRSPKRSVKAEAPKLAEAKADEQGGFYRPSREGKQLIAGHFPRSVAKQLKLLSVEDDTTVQELLAEALDLLFIKKGKARIADITRRPE